VIVGNPRVDHRDRDAAAPRRNAPRFGGVDVRIRNTGRPVNRLARAVEAPELREARIVWNARELVVEVRLGIEHARVALERRLGGLYRGAAA
jgi:hypothetical protein